MLVKLKEVDTFDSIKVAEKVPSPIEILEEIANCQTIDLNFEQFWKVYNISWDKMSKYFKTLEDKEKRRRILDYFEKGCQEEALFIEIPGWFNNRVKWLN